MKTCVRLSALLILLTLVLPAQAHRFAPSLLRITEIGPNEYNAVWKTPLQTVSPVPLAPRWPENCEASASGAPGVEGTGRVSRWQLRCADPAGDGLVGELLGVSGLEANQASAMVMLQLRDGRQYQQVLSADKPAFQVPAEPGAARVMGDYTRLGVEHIWGGLDHLLFVFGLILLVGQGTRLLWTITAFTVGHSVTLSLAALGYITYPVALIEFTIALSIFVLALALTRSAGLLREHPWWLAGGFGLLHGMGFAGALAATGLPEDNVPLALLFFNIGIEVGQVAFIALVLLVGWLLREPLRPWQRRLAPLPVYVLGSLSAMWCIERGLEVLA